MNSACQEFLIKFCLLIGLDVKAANDLAEGGKFNTANGMLCRIYWMFDQGQVLFRPELSLPVSARELGGEEVLRIFTVQATLMNELGWWLTANSEGLLLLVSMRWHDDADEMVSAIAMASAAAPAAIRGIVGETL